MGASVIITGMVSKMRTTYHADRPVGYLLPIGGTIVNVNELLDQRIRIRYTGSIYCLACQGPTKKSFGQGYCYKCFITLPETDSCIVSPEKCHFAAGTCRDPAWGTSHCMIEHTVYLGNSSGPKVGITRSFQRLTRWMDQGASQALPLVTVPTRLRAGQVEMILKKKISDRTDWRKLLKGDAPKLDLHAIAADLYDEIPDVLDIEICEDPEVVIRYPVLRYPAAIKSLDLEKTPVVEGRLDGIKGQYLMFDCGVINVRKYGGYEWEFEA